MEQAKACGMETGFFHKRCRCLEDNISRIVRAADSIQVSVDGTQTTHDTLRKCPGAFTGALRALDLPQGEPLPPGMHDLDYLTVQHPPARRTLHTCHSTRRYLADRDSHADREGRKQQRSLFVGKRLRSLLDFTGAKMKGRFPVILGENLGYLGDLYDTSIHRHDFFFCGIGILSCCIGADGVVRGCPELPPEAKYSAGDVTKDSFSHIWETGFSRFRERIPKDLPAGCSDCRDLDLCRGGCAVMGRAGMQCTRDRING